MYIVVIDIISIIIYVEYIYIYICKKQSVSKYKPQNSKVCPCALLIVIANANRIGNCNLLN